MSKPHKFVPFERDNQVCNTCGEVLDAHPKPEPPEGYREALWRALIRHGGIHNFYSGSSDHYQSWELRAHLGLATVEELAEANKQINPARRLSVPAKPCSIDWKKTTDPEMDKVGTFTDSESDAEWVSAVVGTLACRCRRYQYQEVALTGKTVGQLIWLVVQAGEMPEVSA